MVYVCSPTSRNSIDTIFASLPCRITYWIIRYNLPTCCQFPRLPCLCWFLFRFWSHFSLFFAITTICAFAFTYTCTSSQYVSSFFYITCSSYSIFILPPLIILLPFPVSNPILKCLSPSPPPPPLLLLPLIFLLFYHLCGFIFHLFFLHFSQFN